MKNIFLKLFIIMTFIGCTTNEFELPNEGSGGRTVLVFAGNESDGGVGGGNSRDFSMVEGNSNVNNIAPISFFDVSRLSNGRTWFFPEGAVDILGSANDTTSTEQRVQVRFKREGVFDIRLVPNFSTEVEEPFNEGVVTFTIGPELRMEIIRGLVLQNEAGNIVLTFTRPLNPETLEDLSAFELKVDGVVAEIASIETSDISTADVTIVPSVPIRNFQTATISYTPSTLVSNDEVPLPAQPLAETDVNIFFFDVLFNGRNGDVDGSRNGNYNFEDQGGVFGFNTRGNIVRERVSPGSPFDTRALNRNAFSFSNLDGESSGGDNAFGNWINFSQGDRFTYPGGVKLLLTFDFKVTPDYVGDFRITIGNNNIKKALNLTGPFDDEWHQFSGIMQPAGDNGTVDDPELTAAEINNAFLEVIGRQFGATHLDQELIIDNLRIIALDQ